MAEADKAKSESLEDMVNRALASEEPIKKPQEIPVRPQSLLERIILSKWTAPACAAAMGAFNYLNSQPPSPDKTENLIASGLLAGVGYITAKLMRQDWLMRKAESVRRKTRPLPLKALSIFSEHPEVIAGGAAAYVTANLVSPMFTSITPSDLFRHSGVVPIALNLSAFLASTIFVTGYSAVSLSLGRIFNLETAKTAYKAWAAVHNAEKERYQQALNHLAQLLETQRSYGKSVALQALAAQLQALNDDSSYIDTFYSALTTEKTSHSARSDWALGTFGRLRAVVVEKAKKLSQQADTSAKPTSLHYLIQGTEAFSVGNLSLADSSFLSAVKEGRNEFLPHAFRAAFLRQTGRQATADLEMRICAEILMASNPEFEAVEGSRNAVFFAGNVALKRNTEPSPLEEERAITGRFRERFGQSVIYPLPVYKRDSFYYLLSEKAISETLLDLIRQKRARFEDFAQAIQLLVQLQKFGMDLYKAGELQLDDRVLQIEPSKPETRYFANRRIQAMRQIERFNGVKLPESYKAAVGQGLAFFDRVLASSPFLTMYKDFNPKNVLKRLFGQMQVLDFELQSLKLLPAQTDIANLLEFTEYLSPAQIERLIDIAAEAYAKENRVRVDKRDFRRIYEFAAFQWHYERLIYRTEESAAARTEEQREAKKKEQVRHLLKAREHLGTIINRQYVSGSDLDSVREAKRELERPIFSDTADYERLTRIVEREEQELLIREPLPISKTKLALASAGAIALTAASVAGAVSVRNNLIPLLNAPVFPQGDKVMLAITKLEPDSSGITREVSGARSIDYYVIDATSDKLRFLTAADTARSARLSAFQDKAAFIRDGRITLYDFVNGEFRTVKDDRFENPEISPNGLWIASNLRQGYISQSTGELWLIRPADMETRQAADIPNSFSPTWSNDGSYLLFLSNNEMVPGKHYADPLKVWINTLNVSSGEIHTGPLISERRRGVSAWSSSGSLAYIVERKGEKQTIQLSDPQFKSAKVVYVAGNRDMSGFDTEAVNNIAFAGTNHLLIQSTLFNQESEGVTFSVSLLNLNSLELTALAEQGFIAGVSNDGSRVIYTCGEPADLCEFDVNTRQQRNLTNTPGLQETSAAYSLGGNKIYVVTYPTADCSEESCPPALFVVRPSTGESKLLRRETDGNLRYSLIAP